MESNYEMRTKGNLTLNPSPEERDFFPSLREKGRDEVALGYFVLFWKTPKPLNVVFLMYTQTCFY
jgi:hypothetical protein